MRRRVALLLALVLAVGVVGAVPAAADEHEGGTYLALGDSVPAGYQPVPGQAITDTGYPNHLFKTLRDYYGFDEIVNLSCPGDDTVEMRFGIGGASEFGSACYGPYAQLPPGGTSQLDAAVEYLLTHPGEVELITITIGANDILACDLNDPDVAICLGAQLGQIGANLPVIIGTLQAYAPGVPIVGMNYYNPNVALWLLDPALGEAALGLTPVFNGTLEAVYGAMGVPVADVETAFKTFKTQGKTPQNVRAACLWTLMCEKSGRNWVLSDWNPGEPGPQPDIHPSLKGHRKIASTFAYTIAHYGLLD
jgi:lysophospholipase L1-like esterase